MSLWLPAAIALMGCVLTACSGGRVSPRTQSVFVTVELADGRTPTKDQVARAQTLILPTVGESGLRLAPNAVNADYEMAILYLPDDADPEKSLVSIVRMRPRVQSSRAETNRRFGEMQQRVRDHQKWAEDQAPRQ